MVTPTTSPVKLQRSASEPPHIQASRVQTRLAFNTTSGQCPARFSKHLPLVLKLTFSAFMGYFIFDIELPLLLCSCALACCAFLTISLNLRCQRG